MSTNPEPFTVADFLPQPGRKHRRAAPSRRRGGASGEAFFRMLVARGMATAEEPAALGGETNSQKP